MERLRARAHALGFDTCRIAAPDSIPDAPARLRDWLEAGAHGDMDWMAETADRRADPRALWDRTRSIVMLGMNYGPESDPREAPEPGVGRISVYARHRDYHDVVKGRLKTLAQWMAKEARDTRLGADQPDADVKVFVDTAPVMEKPLAAAAGMGWQGKHTNLVSREFGSWLFLGSIFTTLDLPADPAEIDHCGTCRACLDACPTDAFTAPYVIDARRCVSYLTIEHKGQIPAALREAVGARIYGCDDCLAACPWNKFAQSAREAKLQARADLEAPRLIDLAALDEAAFRAHFAGGPIKRVGHARFLRNVLLALGNSGDAGALPAALARLDHEAALVRGMAVWAARRLMDESAFAALREERLHAEGDADVRAEWRGEAP